MAEDLPTDLTNWLSGNFQEHFSKAMTLNDEVG